MIIYQITIPKKQDAEVFARFMQEEYFPAVSKGPTRIGQVTDLVLLQGLKETDASDMEHHFIWQVGWSGLHGGNARLENKEVENRFQSFNAKMKRIGMFEEVASLKQSLPV